MMGQPSRRQAGQSLAPEALGKGLRIVGLSKAEHHEVAVLAAQGV
jgi:hypothetical protein